MFYKKFPIFTNFRFINPYAEEGAMYSFSTDLEKIGIENDVAISNGAYVDIVSEPVVINRPKYGEDISVIKVRADVATDFHTIIKEFWVPTRLVVKVENNAAQGTQLKVLNSQIDRSVNFVEEQLVGFLESRFVRKSDDYFIAYLSSQTGCNRGCTFCHLTATGQTSFVDSSHNDFMAQAIQIFKHYRKQDKPAKYMHYNFMARGEPLANNILLDSGDDLLIKLGQVAKDEGLPAKFNISTIMPQTLKKSLPEVFQFVTPTIYYSLYSTQESWRKKWMPAAMEVDQALRMLREYQQFSKKIVKIHYAFIAGENDSIEEVGNVCDAIEKHDLICEFNLVRYNPASPDQGVESSDYVINRNIDLITNRFKGKVQIIPRVGFDVKASCGMFV